MTRRIATGGGRFRRSSWLCLRNTTLPRIALLLAHCLAAGPLPPAHALGDAAKPPKTRHFLFVDTLRQLSQVGTAMNESEKQFSFTRAAFITGGRAESKFLSLLLYIRKHGRKFQS